MADTKLLFSSLLNIGDTSYRYGVYGDVLPGEGAFSTSGSSTTVTASDASANIFGSVAVNDLFHYKVDGTWTTRLITSVSNAPDEITVSSAINVATARVWYWQKWYNGTQAADGWFPVSEYDQKSVEVEWVTDTAASVEFTIEGRINGGGAATLYTYSFTGVGAQVFVIPELVTDIRVGAKITTDAGTNNVKATFIGERFGR